MTCSSGKEYDLSVSEGALYIILGKQLCESSDSKRCIYFRLHSVRSEYLRYINAVHDGSQHTYLVGLASVNVLACPAPPEIAAADHDAYLMSLLKKSPYLKCHSVADALVKTLPVLSCQRLTAQLKKYSFSHNPLVPFLFQEFVKEGARIIIGIAL